MTKQTPRQADTAVKAVSMDAQSEWHRKVIQHTTTRMPAPTHGRSVAHARGPKTYMYRQRAFGDAIEKVEIVRPLPVARALRGRDRHLVVGEPRQDDHGPGFGVKHPPRGRRFGAGAGHGGFVVAKKLHEGRRGRRGGEGDTGSKVDKEQGHGAKKKKTRHGGHGAHEQHGGTGAHDRESKKRVSTEHKVQQRADRAHQRSIRTSNRRGDRPEGHSAPARHTHLRLSRQAPCSTTPTRGATPGGPHTKPAARRCRRSVEVTRLQVSAPAPPRGGRSARRHHRPRHHTRQAPLCMHPRPPPKAHHARQPRAACARGPAPPVRAHPPPPTTPAGARSPHPQRTVPNTNPLATAQGMYRSWLPAASGGAPPPASGGAPWEMGPRGRWSAPPRGTITSW